MQFILCDEDAGRALCCPFVAHCMVLIRVRYKKELAKNKQTEVKKDRAKKGQDHELIIPHDQAGNEGRQKDGAVQEHK